MPFLTSCSIAGLFAKNFFRRLLTWFFWIEASVESLRSSLLLPPAGNKVRRSFVKVRGEKLWGQKWRKILVECLTLDPKRRVRVYRRCCVFGCSKLTLSWLLFIRVKTKVSVHRYYILVNTSKLQSWMNKLRIYWK